MRALVWYALSLLGRGQAYVAPSLLYATALVTLTTGDQGPLTGTYAAVTAVMLVTMTWFTIALLNSEDAIQRTVTAVNAGGGRRVLLANVIAAGLICLALSAVGLVYPILAGRHAVTAAAVLVGALAQVACGAVGMAIGLVTCRQVVPRTGYAVLAAVALLGVVVIVRALPPVGPTLVLLYREESPGRMLPSLVVAVAEAGVILAASFLASHALARRRD